MNPGRYNRLVTIQEMAETRDLGGGKVEAWGDFCQLWALKQNGTGNESVNADRHEYTNTTIWTVRFRSDVTTKMRLVDDIGEVYNIEGIEEIGRRQAMKLTTIIHK
jgi:SPP1 family predicted phage head-tail adaptor